MGDSWVTIELPYSEEGVSEELLLANLRSILPAIRVFVPTLRFRDKRGEYTYSLFDGYVFVTGPYTDSDYLKLEDSAYVRKLLCTPGGQRVAYVPDGEIKILRDKLHAMIPDQICEGQDVEIKEGLFSGLEGRIVGVEDDKALVEVYMPLGSLTKLTRIPKMFLEPKDTPASSLGDGE